MSFSIANLDIGGIFSGVGQLARDIRVAVTGKEPISADKAAEIALKVQELESSIDQARIGIMVAEASSTDKWTSRARPGFLYLFYFVVLVLAIGAPFVGIFYPAQMTQFYINVKAGFEAVPEAMWWTFTTGYLGYVGARQWGKTKGTDK
uniref:Putative holin n=1 Tax=viral metagenome TaxID=1070528 RepID=A0A6M3LVB7_9ZZZZ